MDRLHTLFIQNVLRQMEARQWTQADLARKAEMKASQLSRYFTGESVPTLAVIDRLADAMNTTPARLLAGPEEQPNLREAVTLAGQFLLDFGAKGMDSAMLRELAGLPPASPRKKE